jgi:hypothetical protein
MPAIEQGQSTQPVVYVGHDSGNRIVECNQAAFPGLMVVTQSTQPDASNDCSGFAWLDLRTGLARLQLQPLSDVETLPFVIHDIPSECSAVLRSTPPIVGDALIFHSGASVRMVQCWLLRFFGPQAAPQSIRVSQVDFANGMQTLDLVSDVVIRAGKRLSLSGQGCTLRVGKQQVQVHPGGTLEMVRLSVAESEVSSAVVVEGVAAVANSTFVDCSARLNAVSEHGLESHGGAIAVIGGGMLRMHQGSMRRNVVRDGAECSGAALLVSESSSAELDGIDLTNNIATGGWTGSYGGAVRVRSRSSLRLLRSMLARNVADGKNRTSLYAAGGAIYIDGNCVGEVDQSKIEDNMAISALVGPAGGALYVFGSRLVIAVSKINRNIAEDGVYLPAGGAIYLSTCTAEIVDCELLENVARGGAYAEAGTRAQRKWGLICRALGPRHSSMRADVHRCLVRLRLKTKDERLVDQRESSR